MGQRQQPVIRIGSTVEHCGRKFVVSEIVRGHVVLRRQSQSVIVSQAFVSDHLKSAFKILPLGLK